MITARRALFPPLRSRQGKEKGRPPWKSRGGFWGWWVSGFLGWLVGGPADFSLSLPAYARKDKPPAEVQLTPWWKAADYPGETEIEDLIFAETNQERGRAGGSPLRMDESLRAAARQHSQEMLELDYFSHTSPRLDWADPPQRASWAGSWESQIGENIGKNYTERARTAQEIATTFMEGWMESPLHRENILRPEFTHLGVGVVQREGWFCGTQVFATRYYEVQQASLREITEKMICVRWEVVTRGTWISVWVNQCLRKEVKAQVPGPTVIELAFPVNSGTQEIGLATEGKIYFTASLDTTQSLRKALTVQPRGPGVQVVKQKLKQVKQTHYLFSGQARLLQPVKKVRLFLDDSHLENLSWNQQEEIAWAVRLPKGSGRHRIGLFPDQWKKYLFFVDTDQPLAKAFLPRFSPD